ncbi:nucleotide exchange factor GrpE [Orrella marina]|uniref:Protein GrpE n=1 Tax=Orrella marina TaxID=2163011 RepID=A0A2R4XK16_9BURK|nr:nucleotide exchange factor GrpE [Orrella marina]AWB34167.1 nucleotide exchange factor GrpE [Orrella marina]
MTSHPDANRPSDQADVPGQNDQAQASQCEPNPEQQADVNQDPVQEIERLKAELSDKHDMMLRAHAESENIRRRSQEEVTKARKFAIESFAESLVPVRDSLEAALAVEQQTLEAMREGVETTLKQLNSAFERNHLKEIMPAVGDKFDPHHHQAIATVPAEQPSNTIVTVLQKGYLITDRVLRPALVTVAS